MSKTAAEKELKRKDDDGIPIYWRGVHGDRVLIDEKDVIRAMQSFFDQELLSYKERLKTDILDKINALGLSISDGYKADAMREIYELLIDKK